MVLMIASSLFSFLKTTLLQLRFREFPVRQIIQEYLDEIFATVLVVEIVGVLPYIARQKRGLFVRQRRIRVGGLDDLQDVTVLYKPDPPAAELCDCEGNAGSANAGTSPDAPGALSDFLVCGLIFLLLPGHC